MMPGKSFLAALLLPLPFAALPLVTLLFVHASQGPGLVVRTTDTSAASFGPAAPVVPLTVQIEGQSHTGCADPSSLPIEG